MDLIHKHLLITARIENPVKDEEEIKAWLLELVDLIGMKVAAGPISSYVDVVGNRGLTASICIQTSHIALHIWDELEPALIQMDVYSCADFESAVVVDHLDKFGIKKLKMSYLDRSDLL